MFLAYATLSQIRQSVCVNTKSYVFNLWEKPKKKFSINTLSSQQHNLKYKSQNDYYFFLFQRHQCHKERHDPSVVITVIIASDNSVSVHTFCSVIIFGKKKTFGRSFFLMNRFVWRFLWCRLCKSIYDISSLISFNSTFFCFSLPLYISIWEIEICCDW